MPRLERGRDDGAVAIIVALFAVVLFGFAALVVDVGNAQDVRAQLQNAADAAALAGESELASWANTHGSIIDSAEQANLVSIVKASVTADYPVSDDAWTDCSDPVSAPFVATDGFSCIQYTVSTVGEDPNAAVTGTSLRVRIPPKKVPASFGGVFGVGSITASPVSAATAGQNPPSPCQACDTSLTQLPETVRTYLPNPSDPIVPVGTVDATGCPSTPGRFDTLVTITGSCSLPAGLYLFDAGGGLTVTGSLASQQLPDETGVTLVFYDNATLTVDGSLQLVASPAYRSPALGQPIPGVAVVIDQFDLGVVANRSFELGASFSISGSVYAIGADTTWKTADGDCPVTNPAACYIHDDDSGGTLHATLAVTNTDWGDGGRVPTVDVDSGHPVPLPAPSKEHLSE